MEEDGQLKGSQESCQARAALHDFLTCLSVPSVGYKQMFSVMTNCLPFCFPVWKTEVGVWLWEGKWFTLLSWGLRCSPDESRR